MLGDAPPRLVLDPASSKLVFAMPSSELGDPPQLARCNLDTTVAVVVCASDGTACTGRSLGLSYAYPGAYGYDTLRGRVVMAAKNSSGDFVTYPTAFSFCDVAGNPCTTVTRTPPEIANDLGLGKVLYDAANDKLLVVAGGQTAQCAPDASTCISHVVGGPTNDAIFANIIESIRFVPTGGSTP